MKYLVFTTKHHDGFCMFDTKTTDYKITSNKYPYSKDPNANITKVLFDAFRKKDFIIGTYYSKPDWHNEYFWWPYYETGDRSVNYDPKKHPKRWDNFKNYCYNQIEELMTNYGDVDILWLDGAQVQPMFNQDIDMANIAKMARKHQPGLMVVDRLVESGYQDYLTPENTIPDEQIPVPWESCITMADEGWSYRFDVGYKSTNQIIHTLVNIIAKGGNLLLNIGPDSLGQWDEDAYDRLEEIGKWMDVNSEAVYKSRALEVYKEESIFFVKKNEFIYAFYLLDENQTELPKIISMNSYQPKTKSIIKLLGEQNDLKWEKNGKGTVIHLDEKIRKNTPSQHVLTFKFKI